MKNTKSRIAISVGGLFLVLVLVFTSIVSTQANPGSLIDFEGIPEGTIVDTLFSGYGISGDVVSGEVEVFGFNPEFGPDTNTAMIFDASCQPAGTPAGCTGGDTDLFWPDNGNVLIISEDLDTTDPDDADVIGAVFEFDFSGWGTGVVTVGSISVLDVETEEQGDATLELFAGGLDGTMLGEFIIPETGNAQHQEIVIGVSGVDAMRVDLDGSGAITNIDITPDITTITPTITGTTTATATSTSTATPTTTATPTMTATPTATEPNAVKLLSFQVDEVSGLQVKLSWETAAEIDNYGFRLYRSQVPDFTQADLIHFEAAGRSIGGNSYSYTDTAPGEGSWWYWLTDIDTQGRETLDEGFNPVSASVTSDSPAAYSFRVFLPLSITSP